jgi:protein TonB
VPEPEPPRAAEPPPPAEPEPPPPEPIAAPARRLDPAPAPVDPPPAPTSTEAPKPESPPEAPPVYAAAPSILASNGGGDGPSFVAGQGTGSGHVRVDGTAHRAVVAPPAAPRPAVLAAEKVDRPPRELGGLNAAYPAAARRRQIEGSVRVRVLIDERGRVANASVLAVDGDESFRDAVLAAAPSWRFSPAMHEGKPAKVYATKTVRFALGSRR